MTGKVGARPSDDSVILADAIVRAWEASAVPFDKPHELQLALVAARFLVRVANSKERGSVHDSAAIAQGEGQ